MWKSFEICLNCFYYDHSHWIPPDRWYTSTDISDEIRFLKCSEQFFSRPAINVWFTVANGIPLNQREFDWWNKTSWSWLCERWSFRKFLSCVRWNLDCSKSITVSLMENFLTGAFKIDDSWAVFIVFFIFLLKMIFLIEKSFLWPWGLLFYWSQIQVTKILKKLRNILLI